MKYATAKIGINSVKERLSRMARDLDDTIAAAKPNEACYTDALFYLADAMKTMLEEVDGYMPERG